MGRRRGHTEEQILATFRHVESGTNLAEICREVGISKQTFYVWPPSEFVSQCQGQPIGSGAQASCEADGQRHESGILPLPLIAV